VHAFLVSARRGKIRESRLHGAPASIKLIVRIEKRLDRALRLASLA
jgi:hypothetical protein